MDHQTVDRPADSYGNNTLNTSKPGGLLSRFVPTRILHSSIFSRILRLTRVLQFLSAIISLGIFSSRLYKVYRLVNKVEWRRINSSYGAVEGILAAALLYTLAAVLLSCLKRNSSPGTKSWVRWVWVLLDLAFVGAFIAVSVLTGPKGLSGPRHCYRNGESIEDIAGNGGDSDDNSCNLPWGTFVLAIISTILHAITAAFHEVRTHHQVKRSKRTRDEEKQEFVVRNGVRE